LAILVFTSSSFIGLGYIGLRFI